MAIEIKGAMYSIHSFNEGYDSQGPTTIYYIKANDGSTTSAPIFSITAAVKRCRKLNGLEA